ncbi:MAG: hypothetical protein RIB98_05380 [Acidimicrobiales bacterium]
MTEPNEIDQASLDRVARLQQRRQPSAPRPTQEPARDPARRRRRPHPAAGGRILAAGIGATTMFGITAVLAVEATAGTEAQPDAAALPAEATGLPVETTTVPGAGSGAGVARVLPGTLPPGFTVNDIDLALIPEGGVLTGELSDGGRPVVVVFHSRTTPTAAPATAAGSTVTPAPAAAAAVPAAAAPTPLTATPVITEVRVPAAAPAPAPAPAATTSGS